MKFKYKSTLRNIFRNKKNIVLTLIGISGSTALLFAGFGVKDSVDLAGKYQFDEMMQYNLEININDHISLPELVDYDQLFIMATNAQYQNKDHITIIIPEETEKTNLFINFRKSKKNEIIFNNSSVIITKQFALKHELKVGDDLELSIQDKSLNFKITNIQEYYFGNNIYIAKEMFENEFDLKYNKLYVRTGSLEEEEKMLLAQELDKNNSVIKTMFEEDLKYSFRKTSDSLYSIIVVLVIAASALAIIINYNLTLINIHTRKREIATLKVLGYQEIEVSGYVFRETFIISTVAIIMVLFIGKALHYFVISRIVIDGVLLYNDIWWPSYIYTVVLSFLFLMIVFIMSIPQTRRINMVDALKSYE